MSAADATAFTTLASSLETFNGKAQAARQASKDATKQLQSSVDAPRALEFDDGFGGPEDEMMPVMIMRVTLSERDGGGTRRRTT